MDELFMMNYDQESDEEFHEFDGELHL